MRHRARHPRRPERAGFRRILIVNGHGGNQPAQSLAIEWMADNPDAAVKFHNWWNAPKTWAKVQEIDPVASHASWMENFPWTRLAGVVQPTQQKPMIDLARMRLMSPEAVRAYLGDGNFGGYYERPDEEMLAIWDVAVEETRDADRRRLGMSGVAEAPDLGRRRHRRHARAPRSSAPARTSSSSTAWPTMSRRSTRDGLAITGPIVEFRVQAPAL